MFPEHSVGELYILNEVIDGTFSQGPLDNPEEVMEHEVVVEQEPPTAVIPDSPRRSEMTNRAHGRDRFPVS